MFQNEAPTEDALMSFWILLKYPSKEIPNFFFGASLEVFVDKFIKLAISCLFTCMDTDAMCKYDTDWGHTFVPLK